MAAPTEKQIVYANEIARTLNLDFPRSSREFTHSSYSKFISTNQLAYKAARYPAIYDDEDYLHWMSLYDTDVWYEHY